MRLYRRPARPWLSVGLPVLLLAGGLAFGFARLSTGDVGAPIRFGLAAVDRPSSDDTRAMAREPAIWGTYRAAVDQLGRRGAQMIVLPEAIDIVPPSRAPALLSELSGAARTSRVWLLAGVATADGARMSNRAWAFAPDGGRVADYAKHHPAPGEADLITPGSGYSTFDLDGRRAGVAICKDLDFPALPRRYGQMGSSVMVVPASDFGMDGWLHARMAVLRGVEDGFYVVRAAEHGLLSVSDPFGRVLAQASSQPGGGATLMVQAPIGPRIRTVYSRIGDVFGDLSILALVAGWIAIAVRPSRPAI